MPRVKEFDREKALDRAMNFFWEHGYKAASLKELLEAMGIGRQSLYNTFGDKHRLFLEALERYYDMGMCSIISKLEDPNGGLQAIEDYFNRVCDDISNNPGRSCLIINSANELAPHDPEVAAIVNRFIVNLQKAFVKAIQIAELNGVVQVADIEKAAWNLTNSGMGFGPMGKAQFPQKVLKDIAEEVLDTIRA